MAHRLVSPSPCQHHALKLTSHHSRPKSLKSDFKKPGPDAMGAFRCVLISGPPGIGKTTAAHLVAKLQGYDILELNASDVRSKKLLEVSRRTLSRGHTRACADFGLGFADGLQIQNLRHDSVGLLQEGRRGCTLI